MVHEVRTDYAMWLGSLLLLIAGAGRWSLEVRLTHATSRPFIRESPGRIDPMISVKTFVTNANQGGRQVR